MATIVVHIVTVVKMMDDEMHFPTAKSESNRGRMSCTVRGIGKFYRYSD